jgi:hypothetical protein
MAVDAFWHVSVVFVVLFIIPLLGFFRNVRLFAHPLFLCLIYLAMLLVMVFFF